MILSFFLDFKDMLDETNASVKHAIQGIVLLFMLCVHFALSISLGYGVPYSVLAYPVLFVLVVIRANAAIRHSFDEMEQRIDERQAYERQRNLPFSF